MTPRPRCRSHVLSLSAISRWPLAIRASQLALRALPLAGAATALLLAVASLSGCASWSNWPEPSEQTGQASAAPRALSRVRRSIQLQSRFFQIHFDPADPDPVQSIWQWVDETVVPPAERQALHRNGLRVGKALQTQRVLEKLESLQRAEQQDVVDQFLASASVSSHQSEGTDTIPMRVGKRYEMPVRLPLEGPHVVIVDDQPQPLGRTLLDPQFLFAITPERAAASPVSLRLRVRPEVQHGDMQQDWVRGDAALRIDVRRQSWSLEDLGFALKGREGDVFVLGETWPRRGLGKLMLGGRDVDGLQQQTLVVLRLENIPAPSEKL
jgi:hypothetical protein